MSKGFRAPEEERAEWIKFQIELALKKALAHGRDGLADISTSRAVANESVLIRTAPEREPGILEIPGTGPADHPGMTS